jgi:hypothetical protein
MALRALRSIGIGTSIICLLLVLSCDDTATEVEPYSDGGSDGCFQGNLTIENESDVERLAPFTCITGNLVIAAPELTILDLPELNSIGGVLSIVSIHALTNLDGLSGLETIHGTVGIDYNDALQNIDGLSSLKTVGESMYISFNNSLQNLDGLSGLETVGGTFLVRGNNSLACDPTALTAQITATDEIRFCGNGPGNSCGPASCE